jgi:hypothetical protein
MLRRKREAAHRTDSIGLIRHQQGGCTPPRISPAAGAEHRLSIHKFFVASEGWFDAHMFVRVGRTGVTTTQFESLYFYAADTDICGG